MIAIVDYGVGNLFSITSSLKAVSADVTVTGDADEIRRAEKIILPGVGAFGDALNSLKETGLYSVLKEEAMNGKPFLGICLGMQLLFEKSYEFGEYDGLGLIPGSIEHIGKFIPSELKIPQMGWNSLSFTENGHKSPMFKYLNNGDFVYFVHSYHAVTSPEFISATAEYGAHLTAAVENGNVFGMQFHPEKSGSVGLSILRAFCEL